MSYRNTYMHFKYYLIASFSTTLLIAPVLAPQLQLAHAGSKSPYDSGYDHGCDDAGISDPSDRYINEPGKGASFHTDELMQGYNAGYNNCSDGDSTASNGSQTPTDRDSSNSDNGTQDLDETNPSPNQPIDNRYYEGLDWTGVCNDAHRYGFISQPCDTLATSDGNALTSEGKQVMEGALCPRGQGVIKILELFRGPIPDNLENELATACGW